LALRWSILFYPQITQIDADFSWVHEGRFFAIRRVPQISVESTTVGSFYPQIAQITADLIRILCVPISYTAGRRKR
jgi:hypothetical protein